MAEQGRGPVNIERRFLRAMRERFNCEALCRDNLKPSTQWERLTAFRERCHDISGTREATQRERFLDISRTCRLVLPHLISNLPAFDGC